MQIGRFTIGSPNGCSLAKWTFTNATADRPTLHHFNARHIFGESSNFRGADNSSSASQSSIQPSTTMMVLGSDYKLSTASRTILAASNVVCLHFLCGILPSVSHALVGRGGDSSVLLIVGL